ncbi:hypothetical protein ACFWN7_09900 [Agromyces sp. NPDC058484]|uniref:hypothetical protein n=1 Tax=Agromyces sp. NPDC058484 TaxID=3346524 RepID=UPI00366452E0
MATSHNGSRAAEASSPADASGAPEPLIALHLDPDVWSFGFDNAKKRAGLCNYTARRISVSWVAAPRRTSTSATANLGAS